MNMAALQDGEVGRLEELGCPWLAKLYPALLAIRQIQHKAHAFGNKTVVLHGESKPLPAMHQPQKCQASEAQQAGHKCAVEYWALEACLKVTPSASQPAMESSYIWPTFQTPACLLWHLRSAACILYCRLHECAAASAVLQAL